MRNWKEYVRERLALDGLKPAREERIVEELAGQLAEFYRDAQARGATDSDAEAFAQNQVKDWTCFESDIRRAERPHTKPRIEQWHDRAAEAGHRQNGQGGLFTMMTDLRQDVLYGLRMLRRNPGFTAVAVLTLALGIGANTAIFSVVNAVMLRPLPFEEPDRLVYVWESNPGRGWPRFSVSPPNFMDWRVQNLSFENLAAYNSGTSVLTGSGDAERIPSVSVSSGFFQTMRTPMEMGRGFEPGEEVTGNHLVTVLSYGF